MPVPPMSDQEDDERFSNEDDSKLAEFIWVHGIHVGDRSSVQMYRVLGPQASDEFAWSRPFPAEAWCKRYKAHASEFDAWAASLQREREESERRRRERAPTAGANAKPGTREGQPEGGASGRRANSRGRPPPRPPHTTHLSPYPAVRLARAARKSMFSIDFAWAIYLETGSVKETKATLVKMAAAAEARLVGMLMVKADANGGDSVPQQKKRKLDEEGNDDTDADDEGEVGKRLKKRKLSPATEKWLKRCKFTSGIETRWNWRVDEVGYSASENQP
ncbi:hypothetical protein C8F04DRAFT_1180969 [Mycena alexandri]|uniref:Uncharacterized protein n=1 Tax=Mycena alexandri TaxID=1745969 RepID=A0AAD6X2W0_9AGAR|nr:hypothetical protein C8F04DRAFT_1180969 [Mycena alexandri]